MPPALSPVHPKTLRKILKFHGYVVVGEDDLNWALARMDDDPPIILPKRGKLVAVEVMMDVLNKAAVDNATYFDFLSKAEEYFAAKPATE